MFVVVLSVFLLFGLVHLCHIRPLWSLVHPFYRICAVLSVFGVNQGIRVSRGILLINVSLGVNRVRLIGFGHSLVGFVDVHA